MGYEVSIKAAKDRFGELVRAVERGEAVTITRNGKPVVDMNPHRPKGGFNRAALEKWKADRGITHLAGPYDGDFDEPFDEDFLIKPSL
jgi:antitoxin (DNA-binding transcriptional repressor) of toxin-antitoxin stability system